MVLCQTIEFLLKLIVLNKPLWASFSELEQHPKSLDQAIQTQKNIR